MVVMPQAGHVVVVLAVVNISLEHISSAHSMSGIVRVGLDGVAPSQVLDPGEAVSS
jgi:hypothetical protein